MSRGQGRHREVGSGGSRRRDPRPEEHEAHRRRSRLGELAKHSETLVAKGRGRRCDRCGGTVSVLTRGDLPAESGEPTGEAERSVLGGQESAEAIVPTGEPCRWGRAERRVEATP